MLLEIMSKVNFECVKHISMEEENVYENLYVNLRRNLINNHYHLIQSLIVREVNDAIIRNENNKIL